MNNIKAARLKKGLTQEELGRKVNVQKSAISKYERGFIQPSQDVLINLAEVLETSVDYLLGRTDSHRSSEIAAASSDVPYDELPPEALQQLEDYKKFLIEKYGRKKQ